MLVDKVKKQQQRRHVAAPPYLIHLMDADSLRAPLNARGDTANHATMAMVALHSLGATEEEVTAFENKFISNRKEWFPPASRHPATRSGTIKKNNFAQHLGSSQDVFNFREFFRTQISAHGISAVFQEYLSEMEPWLHHGQWHALLRWTSVLESGHPDPRLVADGLAYLAVRCKSYKESFAQCPPDCPAAPLPVTAALWKAEEPVLVWEHLRLAKLCRSVELWINTQLQGKRVDDHPHEDVSSVMAAQFLCSFPDITNWAFGGGTKQPATISPNQELSLLLAQMQRLAMQLYLTIPRGSTLHGFTVAQGVAALVSSGIMAPDQQARIVSRFWVWLTALYIEKDTPSLVTLNAQGLEVMEHLDWNKDLLPKVRVMHGHAHIIKLTYSCYWFWTHVDSDPMMKFAVLRCLEADHPWRADQIFACERYLQATAESEAFRASNRVQARAHVSKLMVTSDSSWDDAWKQRTTPWDLGSANKVLVTCLDRVPPQARCLVPGCGSGHDLLALANGKRSVCGLEISNEACKIACQITAGNPSIQVVESDFFKFSSTYDFIFDHTFFCALPIHIRDTWATKMAELLHPNGLLLAVVWPLGHATTKDTMAGPPFKSSLETYYQLLNPKGLELENTHILSVSDNLGERTVAATWWRRSMQTTQDLSEIAQILGHWFRGENGSHNPDHRRVGTNFTQVQFWMLNADTKHDAFIKSKFEAMYESVQSDQVKLERWRSSAKGCVALVLLLDQFPRHMFRGTSRMFEMDQVAMEVAAYALETYMPKLAKSSNVPQIDGAENPFGWPMSWSEVWFLTITWSHSEQILDHDMGIKYVQEAITCMPKTRNNDASRAHYEKVLIMAQKHKSLIAKYGRYPHRNAVLGRETTKLEAQQWIPQDSFERSVPIASTAIEPSAVLPAPELKIYLARYSANCLGPWLTLRWLQKHKGLEFEVIDVDILNAEQMTPEYRNLNPNHTVPMLLDLSNVSGTGPTVVFESHAIMRYLAGRYDVALNPPLDSTSVSSSICWALEFRLGRLYPALEKVTYPAMGFSQDFESVDEWKFCLDATLRDFTTAFLPDSKGLIGGSMTPTIADFAIAPCFFLLMVSDLKPPRTVIEYFERFLMACPDASTIAQGDGGFGIIDYINRRKEGGYVKHKELREYQSQNPVLLLPRMPVLTLSSSVFCLESLPVRILMELLEARGISSRVQIEYQSWCADPFSAELPLLHSERGSIVGGCNSILRYICDVYKLKDMYPDNLQTRVDVETALDFCCTVLQRFMREAMFPVYCLGGNPEKAPQAKSRLPGAMKVIERLLLKRDKTAFLCSTQAPTIADLAVVPCLFFFSKIGLDLSPILDEYLSRCCIHWGIAGTLLEQVKLLEPLPLLVQKSSSLASHSVTEVDLLQASANQELHHLGSVADPITMIIHVPLQELPQSHHEWDDLSAEMPQLVRNLKVRKKLDKLSVLDASEASLPDQFLARASSLLAIFAHAYWHNEYNNVPKGLPLGILLPWEQVTKRLGRPVPVMTYEDLYTYNWTGNPRSVATMRLATPNTGSTAEQRFYLGTVAISCIAAPIIDLALLAAKQCEANDIAGLVVTMQQI